MAKTPRKQKPRAESAGDRYLEDGVGLTIIRANTGEKQAVVSPVRSDARQEAVSPSEVAVPEDTREGTRRIPGK